MNVQAHTQAWRAQHRTYGICVPMAEVQFHLLNGFTIISDAEDIRDDVLMRPPVREAEAA